MNKYEPAHTHIRIFFALKVALSLIVVAAVIFSNAFRTKAQVMALQNMQDPVNAILSTVPLTGGEPSESCS